ncbi:M1 family aminopeptidase [Alistipes sp. OttesenSCG-928-B03]|nr:M1 family aminopeptidase [Alistipes sp. OttesenSCG-928-B03]
MKAKYLVVIAALALFSSSCRREQPSYDHLVTAGVSLELAQFRAEHYSDVSYDLRIIVPQDQTTEAFGTVEITATLSEQVPIIVDFTGRLYNPVTVTVNNMLVHYTLADGHFVIPADKTRKGENRVVVHFVSEERGLNRRPEFCYTLLVPDRARTLFPCFDQPNLKARFSLELTVPEGWKAVANGAMNGSEPAETGYRKVTFDATEPISSYLFSFACGVFDEVTEERAGRSVTLYHRETDRSKVAQCPEILDEVFKAIEWMEEYTAVPYPFQKYDLVILPGFQYGGMEHMGATLYNDRRMFLEANATELDRMQRSNLIAHETAHMWFGDYVTMRWFNDVWNKEVFANWFADRITEPLYPDIDHHLNFVRNNMPAAYSADRTAGTVAIQQPLDNLSDAGLVYSNIIYNKSPLVMDMLVARIGQESFRAGMRDYMRRYAYGNSDWDGLIDILAAHSTEDLRAWSDVWVKQKGMPRVSYSVDGDVLTIAQSDPWGRDMVWEQELEFIAIAGGEKHRVLVSLDTLAVSMALPQGTSFVLPNSDGRGYGCFVAEGSEDDAEAYKKAVAGDDVARFASIVNRYENLMAGEMDPVRFFTLILDDIRTERNIQIFNQVLAYGESCLSLFLADDPAAVAQWENLIGRIMDEGSVRSRLAAESFTRTASSDIALSKLFRIWHNERFGARYRLSERNYTSIAYQLAVRFPEHYDEIGRRQLARITNPDRRAEFEFIWPALSPLREVRDSVFNALLDPANRTVEPWAQTALALLNHPARQEEALGYIRPALDKLQEVQHTGDIFFPSNWCAALLSGHTSPEALTIVQEFLADNPRYPRLLATKILQRADHLFVANSRQQERYGR